ncbi:hypothetical protein QOT17_006091 [Balamuthia mandrillaris]
MAQQPTEDSQQSATTGLRVADHFPSIRQDCKDQALEFFHCFSVEGEQKGKEAMAGTRALLTCKTKMDAYDKCMLTPAKTQPKKYIPMKS